VKGTFFFARKTRLFWTGKKRQKEGGPRDFSQQMLEKKKKRERLTFTLGVPWRKEPMGEKEARKDRDQRSNTRAIV
jgi:hypothetical protein